MAYAFGVTRANSCIPFTLTSLPSTCDLRCCNYLESLCTHYAVCLSADPTSHSGPQPGNIDDVAGLILFLVSKAGAYVNGATHVVDGGVRIMGGRRGQRN